MSPSVIKHWPGKEYLHRSLASIYLSPTSHPTAIHTHTMKPSQPRMSKSTGETERCSMEESGRNQSSERLLAYSDDGYDNSYNVPQKRPRTWIKLLMVHGLLIASYTTIFIAYMVSNFKNHHPNFIYCMFLESSTTERTTIPNMCSPGKKSR
jgi:hypothetical protein